MSDSSSERRRFCRIAFQAPATLSRADQAWRSEVLDVSLKGVLLDRPQDWQAAPESRHEIVITLGDEAQVAMVAELAHEEAHQLGFHCLTIDIESVSHLRRLVELNLGDEALLERDLAALGEAD